ncbi:hypothetical protein [Actinocorallia longicatena]|uniref:Uncharacterized protein n=1 Tax=Actinocorallia longicatena TaxID=111803 RepID=A0ABP6QGT3_9ACTN
MNDRHTPRSAALLFADALECLDLLEPALAREPIRHMLRAGIEQCASSHSLLGKPVNYLLQLAEVLVDEGRHRAPTTRSDDRVESAEATLARVREVVADMRAVLGMQGWVVTLTAALNEPGRPA